MNKELVDRLRVLIRAETEPMIYQAIERIERTLLVLAKRYEGEACTALIGAAGAIGDQKNIYVGVPLKPPVDLNVKKEDGRRLWTDERRAKFMAYKGVEMDAVAKRNKEIVEDCRKGKSTRELCETYRLSEQTIYDVLRAARKAGELPPAKVGKPKNPMVAERDKKIQKLIDQGLSYPLIAVRLGISHRSVVATAVRLRKAQQAEPVDG